MRGFGDVRKSLRGRPRLDIEMGLILMAVRERQKVTTAARELDCSPAYIHARLRAAGLTLAEVLEAT
jgi:predicted nicotinamide N-methyase